MLTQRVSGMSFRAFTTRAIFAPLGMTHTLWRATLSELVPNRALPYTPDDSRRYQLDLQHEAAAPASSCGQSRPWGSRSTPGQS